MEVPSDPRLLASVRGFVREWLGVFGLTQERVDEVVLGVDEACSNAIRHAYRGTRGGTIELTLRADWQWIEAEVCDRGATAAPEHLEGDPPAEGEDAWLRPGGRGLQLMRAAFDEVAFEPRSPCGNRVLMRLRRAR